MLNVNLPKQKQLDRDISFIYDNAYLQSKMFNRYRTIRSKEIVEWMFKEHILPPELHVPTFDLSNAVFQVLREATVLNKEGIDLFHEAARTKISSIFIGVNMKNLRDRIYSSFGNLIDKVNDDTSNSEYVAFSPEESAANGFRDFVISTANCSTKALINHLERKFYSYPNLELNQKSAIRLGGFDNDAEIMAILSDIFNCMLYDKMDGKNEAAIEELRGEMNEKFNQLVNDYNEVVEKYNELAQIHQDLVNLNREKVAKEIKEKVTENVERIHGELIKRDEEHVIAYNKLRDEYKKLEQRYNALVARTEKKSIKKKSETRKGGIIDINKNVLFVGGKDDCVKRLKRVFPNAKFMIDVSATFPGTVDYVVYLTSSLSHSLYYNVKNSFEVDSIHESHDNINAILNNIATFDFACVNF